MNPGSAGRLRQPFSQLFRHTQCKQCIPHVSDWYYKQEYGQETYNFARSRLITSSEVITPVSMPSSSTTGRVSRLYLSNKAATSLSRHPAWQEISGSCVSDTSLSSDFASTILASGTQPASLPCSSTR